ncbi:MAG: hypothetical protein J1F35_05475 [Erysipelotrichales bacterium]|nr:hypothetical protein [Erysipelotrichales bacterium]
MEYLLSYIIIFLVILSVLYIFEYSIKDKNESLGLQKSFRFIKKKYDLKTDKLRTRKLSKIIVIANTFILSIPIYIVMYCNLGYFQVLGISFLIFIVLILIIYNLIGYILKKKGW